MKEENSTKSKTKDIKKDKDKQELDELTKALVEFIHDYRNGQLDGWNEESVEDSNGAYFSYRTRRRLCGDGAYR